MVRADVQHRGLGIFQRQHVTQIGPAMADDHGQTHRAVRAQHQAHRLARVLCAWVFAQGQGQPAGALQEAAGQFGRDAAGLGAQHAGEFVRAEHGQTALREIRVIGAEGRDGVLALRRAPQQAAIELDHLLVGDHAATAA